jgi:hypothetical protein
MEYAYLLGDLGALLGGSAGFLLHVHLAYCSMRRERCSAQRTAKR